MVVPTYEYECPKCPRVFEVKQRITEPMLDVCERCGGPIHRLLSATPFILKGGGWYVTDYPSESRKKAMGGDAAAPAPPAPDSKAPDAKGDAKGEAKPARKGSDSSSKEGKPAESKPPKSKSSDRKSSTPAAPSSGSGSSSGGSSSGGAKSA
jgi:putative FmdB family regulatory protein